MKRKNLYILIGSIVGFTTGHLLAQHKDPKNTLYWNQTYVWKDLTNEVIHIKQPPLDGTNRVIVFKFTPPTNAAGYITFPVRKESQRFFGSGCRITAGSEAKFIITSNGKLDSNGNNVWLRADSDNTSVNIPLTPDVK
jgi:hypothetical protein